MTPQDIKSVQDIQGTGGFRVIQSQIEKRMKELESVMTLDSTKDIGRMALARQDAIILLTKFLEDINLISPEREKRKTYE